MVTKKSKSKDKARIRDKWLNLSMSILINKENCFCPSCNSDKINHYQSRVSKEGYGFGIVWCDECKQGIWLSRMEVVENSGIEPPNGIRYV